MYKTLIPNMLTSLNLVLGMCSIISTLQGSLVAGSIFIVLALVADGLDGRAARFFGVSSDFGRELDSLCDLVSFGVAPAFLSYVFYLHQFSYFGWVAAIMFATCGALRLARFNVNTNNVHGFFMGLAIPAGGCLVATFIMLCSVSGIQPESFGIAFPIIIMLVGYLMVSKVHYPDFKGHGEKMHSIPIALSVILAIAVLFVSRDAILNAVLFDIFLSYAVFGILNTAFALMAGEKETSNV